MFLAIQLGCCAFFEKTVLVQLQKDILGDIGLLLCGCPTKHIKTEIEPAIDGSMNGMVFVAKLLGRNLLKKCSRFRTCTVFTGSYLAEKISFRLRTYRLRTYHKCIRY
jgi:hypothetical protein